MADNPTAAEGRPDHRDDQQIVRFLTKLLEQRIPSIRCEYSPQSPYAYSYPFVEDFLRVSSQEALSLLEDLVGEGLLERRLVDKVHLCPQCHWHTLNFVEVCPRCQSLDVGVETVLHHFACGYVGIWSEFRQGVDLVCPKCDDKLRHMGMDYERPSDTFVCRDCKYPFTESKVEARCLRCRQTTPAESVEATRIYEYSPTPKATRAVEYGRLHGLDIHAVLFEDQSRTFRRDFLIFEIDREIYRARRYQSALSLILVAVDGLDDTPDVKDNVDLLRVRRDVFDAIASTLRDLDVMSAVNHSRAAILLPETPLDGAMNVAQRVHKSVSQLQTVNFKLPLVVTAVVGELEDVHECGRDLYESMQKVLLWALEQHPGAIASTDTWKRETANA